MLPKRTPPACLTLRASSRHTKRQSYQISTSHKHKKMTKNATVEKKDQCPLGGKCLTQNVVYQATVTTQTSSGSYVGLATNFKERYRYHTPSFRHKSKRNETELSKHIWTLNGNNKPFTIKWRVLKQCKPHNSISNKCNLCLFEKICNHL